MLNYIGFHMFGMFGVSWGVCILSSTSCICFSKRSRRTYSCIVDHGVAFQMPFLTKKASVQFFVGGASVGLVEQTWTLVHKVKNIKPIRNFRVYCILFSLHRFTQKKLCPKDLPLILQMCEFDQTFANTLSKRRFDGSCEGSSKGEYGQKEISIHIYSFHFSLTSAILVSHHVTTLDSCPLPSAAASKLKPKDQLSLRMWCKSLRCLPGEYSGKVRVEITT